MKKKVQIIARKNDLKVKVIEKAGKRMLQRSDPYVKRGCGRVDCAVCEFGMAGECRTRGCVYQLKCEEDGKVYRGQTGRSVYERVKEEIRDWQKKGEKSPLWRHSELFHQGCGFDLGVKVTDKCFGKPSKRMITEAVMIEQLGESETMNNKYEWTYMILDKVKVG